MIEYLYLRFCEQKLSSVFFYYNVSTFLFSVMIKPRLHLILKLSEALFVDWSSANEIIMCTRCRLLNQTLNNQKYTEFLSQM